MKSAAARRDREALTRAIHHAHDQGTGPFRSCQLQFSVLERPEPEVLAALAPMTSAACLLPLGQRSPHRQVPPRHPAAARVAARGGRHGEPVSYATASWPAGHRSRQNACVRSSGSAISLVDRGHTLLELAISWVASQPTIASVLTGVTSAVQIAAKAAAAGWQLSNADMACDRRHRRARGQPD